MCLPVDNVQGVCNWKEETPHILELLIFVIRPYRLEVKNNVYLRDTCCRWMMGKRQEWDLNTYIYLSRQRLPFQRSKNNITISVGRHDWLPRTYAHAHTPPCHLNQPACIDNNHLAFCYKCSWLCIIMSDRLACNSCQACTLSDDGKQISMYNM